MNKYIVNVNDIYYTLLLYDNVWYAPEHESVQNLMKLIYQYKTYINNVIALDIGCGTGILSIFVSKCGAKSVVAIDINKRAVECTKYNVEKNNIKNIIVEEKNLNNDFYQQFDIIVANLSNNDQIENFNNIYKYMHSNSLLFITWEKTSIIQPLNLYIKHYQIIDYINGNDYDSYVLKLKNKDG